MVKNISRKDKVLYDFRLEKVTTTIHIRNRVFSHDFTAAILVSQNNETAAMLVSQSYANAFICIDAGQVGENVLYESIVIRHFHIFHNAPYLPPQFLHNLCFTFLVGITAVPRNIGNFFFLGGRGGGRLISLIIGNVEVAYGKITLAVATLGPLTAFSGSGIFLV